MMMQKSFSRLLFARVIAVLTSVSDPDWIRTQFVRESGSRQANMVPVPKKGGKKKFYVLKSTLEGWKLLGV
jgi:hypothetical protein